MLTGTETKETYSIMIMLLSLKKRKLSVCEGLWGIYSSTQKEKVTISIWKQQQHSYCFPKKDPQTVLCDRKAFDRFCCCINGFFWSAICIVMLSVSCCYRHELLCQSTRWLLSQISHPHTPPPHPERHKGTKAVGSGPLACKCYCPNVFLSLCVYHNMWHP